MGLSRRELGLLAMTGSMIPILAVSSEVEVDVYPKRPVTLVVGFPPGDSSDFIARHIAVYMATELGQKVIIDNRPGAAGNIGAASVAQAAPDGYTVYLAARPAALHKMMYKDIKYDFSTDFVPVGLLATMPYVLSMGKHVAATNMREAVALARAEPGKFTCAVAGLASTSHLLCEAFQADAGIQLLHVPYNGSAPALNDMIGGRADFAVTSLPAVLPYIASDSVRALAVFSSGRAAAIPSVPHIQEHGYGDVQGDGWCAVMAPAGTPSHAITRLNRAINKALADTDIRKKFVQLGYVMPPADNNTPEALEAFLAEDTEKWTAIVEARLAGGIQ